MKLLRELIMLKEHAVGDTVIISGGEYKGSKGEIVDIINSTKVHVKLKEYGSRVEILMDNLGKKITESNSTSKIGFSFSDKVHKLAARAEKEIVQYMTADTMEDEVHDLIKQLSFVPDDLLDEVSMAVNADMARGIPRELKEKGWKHVQGKGYVKEGKETIVENWNKHPGDQSFSAEASDLDGHQKETGKEPTCPKCKKPINYSHDLKAQRTDDEDNEVTHWEGKHSCGQKLTVWND